MQALQKDNTLFYLLFVIAVFIIISLAKAPKKEAKEEKEAEDPRITTPKVDSDKTYISNGQKYENKAEPQPSVPGSDQYDYKQEGLAGTLNRGQYTK